MSSNSKVKKKSEIYEPTSLLITRWFLWLYLMAFFFVYPLYVENKYYNMGDAKWHFFKAITFGTRWGALPIPGLLMLCGICAIWYLITLISRGEYQINDTWKKMSSLDKVVFIYLICVIIATIVAPDKANVIWGYDGWYMGLVAQVSFVAMYFLVSRFYSPSIVFETITFAVAGFVMLIAVLNRFSIDPLGMYEGLEMTGNAFYFVTTMGNTTWYGCMLSVMLAAGIAVYCNTEKMWVKIASGVFCAIGFMSAVTTYSDAIFAGIFAMFAALLYYSFLDNRRFANFWQILTICLASFKFIGILQVAKPDKAIVIAGLPQTLSQNKMMWIPLIISAAMMVITLALGKNEHFTIAKVSWLRKVVLIVILVGIGLYILYVILNTTGHLPSFVKASDNYYFLFNDYWGDYRGVDWKAAAGTFFKSFKDRPINAIFGWGPDCLSVGVYTYYADQLNAAFGGAILTAAHNEWLNMFVNFGLVGGCAYIGIFAIAVRRFTRNVKEHWGLIAVIVAIFAYFAVDFFCYQQTISTPIIFAMIGFGEYMGYRAIEEN